MAAFSGTNQSFGLPVAPESFNPGLAKEIQDGEIDLGSMSIDAINSIRNRFWTLTILTIVVSFVHMYEALHLFSGASTLEWVAGIGMTIIVDFATWVIAVYIDFAKINNIKIRWPAWLLFGVTLLISATLNFSYLYAHRPEVETLPDWAAITIAVAFAIFIPCTIGVSSSIGGEMEMLRKRIDAQRIAAQAIRTGVYAIRHLQSQRTMILAAWSTFDTHWEQERSKLQRGVYPNKDLQADWNRHGESSFEMVFLETTKDLDSIIYLKEAWIRRESAIRSLYNEIEHSLTQKPNAVPRPMLHRPQGPSPLRIVPASQAPGAGGNHKADILTSDVPAIVDRLRQAGKTSVTSGKEIADICGWSSAGSGPKALRCLLDEGAIVKSDTGYHLVDSHSLRSLDDEDVLAAALAAISEPES